MSTKLFDLQGRHAVVTGGGTGIGLAIAHGLVAHGATVSLWGRREAPLREAAEAIGEDRASWRTVDVADETSVVAAMEAEATDHSGIDIAVLAAGVGGVLSPFLSSTQDDLRTTMDTNLVGLYLTMREAGRHMVEQGRGSIVAISSLAATEGAGRNQAYGASKGAALAMANGVAVELAGKGVRVNTILPGWIATDMSAEAQGSTQFTERVISRVPIRRWGRPDELVGAAVYLASDASSFQTGSTVVIDGGYSIF